MKVSHMLLSFFIISSLVFTNSSQAAPLRFVIAQFPPYTSESNGVYSGIGIDMVKLVMLDIGVDYQLRSTPNYARALEELVRGRADGLFLASENAQRDALAVFSEPLVINRWSWFLAPGYQLGPDSVHFKSKANIATIHGSNTNKWLIEHNYNVTTKANSGRLFPKMLLEKKRINAVFLASAVFRQELQMQGYSEDDYVEVVEQSKPFGIYISKTYLESNPGFMEKLNIAILKVQELH